MTEPARSPEERRRDALERLAQDVDAWVATSSAEGGIPYLVPLSFLWDGHSLLLSTPAASPTSENLQRTGRVRLGIGPTRDVVLVEGTVRVIPAGEIARGVGDAFAAKTGFDPRELSEPYLYFVIQPQRLQAWREANELRGRDLMRNGRWLVTG